MAEARKCFKRDYAQAYAPRLTPAARQARRLAALRHSARRTSSTCATVSARAVLPVRATVQGQARVQPA